MPSKATLKNRKRNKTISEYHKTAFTMFSVSLHNETDKDMIAFLETWKELGYKSRNDFIKTLITITMHQNI